MDVDSFEEWDKYLPDENEEVAERFALDEEEEEPSGAEEDDA